MKKLILILCIIILSASLVAAQGQKGIHEPGTGLEDPELKEEMQGSGQGLQAQEAVATQEQAQGEATQIREEVQTQSRQRLQTGEHMGEGGQQMRVQAQENNRMRLEVGGVGAQTGLQMQQMQGAKGLQLSAQLSNGRNAEIKVMPDTAAEKAQERLRLHVCSEENDCEIELKEVGKGEQVRAAYEVRAQKEGKVFGLFRAQMRVQAQVDAENGNVIQAKKPWWAFLAAE